MFNTLIKIYKFLKLTGLTQSMILFSLIIIGMFLELLGIALIIPILSYLINPEMFSDYFVLNFLFSILDFNSNLNILNKLTILILIVYILKNLFLYLISYIKYFVLNNIQIKLSQKLFEYYMRADFSYHLNKNSAYLIRNLTTEIPNIKSMIFLFITIYTETVIIIFLTSLLLYVNFLIAFCTMLTLGASSLLLVVFFKKLLQILGQIRIEHQGLALKQIMEGIGGIKDTKILSKENYFISKYDYYMQKFNKSDRLALSIAEVPRYFLEIIAVATLVILILVMVYLNYDLDRILLILGVFAVCFFRMMPSFNRFITSLQNISYHKPSLEKIYEIFFSQKINGIVISNNSSKQRKFNYKIELRDISFSYDGKKNIFESLDFIINKKDSIGIFGKSGEGKGTLVNLLIGFIKPTKGQIKIDDEKIKNNIDIILNDIGHVPQNIYLIDASIKENIAFGIDIEKIDIEKLHKSIRLSRLDEFIKNLENGYETVIGEEGIRLSGGQRQRIGIARSLYNDPELIIFDEATNSLDTSTESEIIDDIYSLKIDYTLIIISHNLETLSRCKKIFEVKNKQIIKIK